MSCCLWAINCVHSVSLLSSSARKKTAVSVLAAGPDGLPVSIAVQSPPSVPLRAVFRCTGMGASVFFGFCRPTPSCPQFERCSHPSWVSAVTVRLYYLWVCAVLSSTFGSALVKRFRLSPAPVSFNFELMTGSVVCWKNSTGLLRSCCSATCFALYVTPVAGNGSSGVICVQRQLSRPAHSALTRHRSALGTAAISRSMVPPACPVKDFYSVALCISKSRGEPS